MRRRKKREKTEPGLLFVMTANTQKKIQNEENVTAESRYRMNPESGIVLDALCWCVCVSPLPNPRMLLFQLAIPQFHPFLKNFSLTIIPIDTIYCSMNAMPRDGIGQFIKQACCRRLTYDANGICAGQI